jgi:Na+/H+-dicarboxylate symporter
VGSNGTAVSIALAQLVLSFYALVAIFIVVVLGSPAPRSATASRLQAAR